MRTIENRNHTNLTDIRSIKKSSSEKSCVQKMKLVALVACI